LFTSVDIILQTRGCPVDEKRQDEWMLTVLRYGSFRFHFFSNEGMELAHIHVRSPNGECKFWLVPAVTLIDNDGILQHELRKIERLINENYSILRRAYYEYHHR
jgi:hypothetical protein